MKSKPNKYHNSHKYNMLIKELTILEKQTKKQVTSLIERQIEKVDESLIRLEDYINKKELNDARENARNQISTLLQDVSINAKISMKTEIQALKGALKGTDTSFIQQCAEALTEKEAAVRSEIDKNKNSIVPDSVKTNTQPKD